MVFVDSNIPMYLVGSAHPNKERALQLLDQLTRERKRLVTSSEVYQELVHRFCAIRRRDGILAAFTILDSLVDAVFSVDVEDVRESHRVALTYSGLSARDSLHIASMKKHSVGAILSFDSGFDQVNGIARIA